MAIKLKSALEILRRTLASNRSWLLRGLVFAVLLFFAAQEGFAFWPTLLFVGSSLLMYANPVFQTTPYFLLYVFLMTASFFGMHFFGQGWQKLYMAVFFGFLFFILVGLKNVAFSSRRRWFAFFFSVLAYFSGLIFFLSDKVQYPFLASAALFFAVLVLSRRFFASAEIRATRLAKVYSLVIAFLGLQFAWLLSYLFSGFWISGALFAAYLFILQDLSRQYFSESLTARQVRLYFINFLVLLFASMAAASWI